MALNVVNKLLHGYEAFMKASNPLTIALCLFWIFTNVHSDSWLAQPLETITRVNGATWQTNVTVLATAYLSRTTTYMRDTGLKVTSTVLGAWSFKMDTTRASSIWINDMARAHISGTVVTTTAANGSPAWNLDLENFTQRVKTISSKATSRTIKNTAKAK